MKLLTNLTVAAMFIGGTTISSFGQEEEPKSQMFMVHIDHVISSEAKQYEEANKGWTSMCREHDLKDADSWTFTEEDGDYMHVSMIDNMAALDKNPFEEVQKKAGKEAWAEMYSKFDGTYMSHESFIVVGHPKYSYKSEQSTEEGMNYRVWGYNYFEEKDWEKVSEVAKKWKALYESKNAEAGFNIYSNGMGFPGPVLVVMQWAESPEAFYAQRTKTQELLGEEGKKLSEETAKLFYKHEKVDGWFRPDLSYISESPTSASNE